MIIADKMLANYRELDADLSIKLHFLYCHLKSFLKNFGDIKDEQGEYFHRDIKVIENGYQGGWDKRMIVN